MPISEKKTCPTCGAIVSVSQAEGLCTRCLFQRALPKDSPEESAPPEHSIAEWSVTPERIAGYEIIERIGQGGMGVVYRARQLEINRVVALKMLAATQLNTEEARLRFQTEIETIGALQHPHIVPIYDVGEWEGRPYFSMRLIEGRSLDALIDESDRDDVTTKADLIAKVARAIHCAHQHGILHRDLKPANILLDEKAEPHVADFGLAKQLASDADITRTDVIMGTPCYLAPEQADAGAQSTTAVDVYSLGANLYHLLTGHPPFQGETPLATVRLAIDANPKSPGALNPAVDRDLETICLKCLEKRPQDRYGSALALAEDLERWRNHETIHARPATVCERAAKWARRHPAAAGLIAVSCISVIAFIALVLLGQGELRRKHAFAVEREKEAVAERKETAKANVKLAESVTRLELRRAETLFTENDAASAIGLLAQILRREPDNRVAAQRLISALSHRQFCLPTIPSLKHGGWVRNLEFDAVGKRLLTSSMDGRARIWDVASGLLLTETIHQERVIRAAFSPEGSFFATASGDNTARIWNAESGEPRTPILRHDHVVRDICFSPDGRFVATASVDRTARIWNAETGKPTSPALVHNGFVNRIVFSPNGDRALTASIDGTARIWDTATGAQFGESMRHRAEVVSAEFSIDGVTVVTASKDGEARLWDARTGAAIGQPMKHARRLWEARFSPDGTKVVTASVDRTARVWDAGAGEEIGAPLEHASEVWAACLSPDGERIATGTAGGTVQLWDASAGLSIAEPIRHSQAITDVRFSPDGHLLASASWDGSALISSVRSIKPARAKLTLPERATTADILPLRGMIALGSEFGRLCVWDPKTDKKFIPKAFHQGFINQIRSSPRGNYVATAGRDGTGMILDTRNGRRIGSRLRHASPIMALAFSPDEQWIATASFDGHARIWSVPEGRPVSRPLPHGLSVSAVEFSPDSDILMTASADGVVRFWTTPKGEVKASPLHHDGYIRSARFSPDGRRLLTACGDGAARIWNVETRNLSAPPLRHGAAVEHAEFDATGERVITASLDNTARIWNAETGAPLTPPMRHGSAVEHAEFSSDGSRVLTSSADRAARVWDAKTGFPISELLRHEDRISVARFMPGNDEVLTASWDKTAVVSAIPIPPAGPTPEWFIALAEAVAGESGDAPVSPPAESISSLSTQLASILDNPSTDAYRECARRLLNLE